MLFFDGVISWVILFWKEFACAIYIVVIAVWMFFSKFRLNISILVSIILLTTVSNVPWNSFSVELTLLEIDSLSTLLFSSTVASNLELFSSIRFASSSFHPVLFVCVRSVVVLIMTG